MKKEAFVLLNYIAVPIFVEHKDPQQKVSCGALV